MGRILIVEDDTTFRSLLKTILQRDGHAVSEAVSGAEGWQLLQRKEFDLIISDLKMPGMTGLELYQRLRTETEPPPFILLTAFGTIEQAVAAIKEGVADFLTKPLKDPETLRTLVRRTLQGSSREREYEALKELSLKGLPSEALIFAGNAMTGVRKLVNEVAPTTASVVIRGESGTGKELIARAIHMLSPRRDAGFVPINCAAIPENLLESELFGHEKGAFTTALQTKRGKFELAQGGTIFLDEIGDMPLSLQAKLLRVIQERKFERVGGMREIQADIRIIAATHRDLEVAIKEKGFREDLFYRLNVFPIQLPPLRERKDALPLLVDYFIGRFTEQTGKKIKSASAETVIALLAYNWPGNIRELQNVMERAVIVGAETIQLKDLPAALTGTEEDRREECHGSLKSLEKEAILKALEDSSGNRRKAAAILGIARRTLQYRLKDYGITNYE